MWEYWTAGLDWNTGHIHLVLLYQYLSRLATEFWEFDLLLSQSRLPSDVGWIEQLVRKLSPGKGSPLEERNDSVKYKTRQM